MASNDPSELGMAARRVLWRLPVPIKSRLSRIVRSLRRSPSPPTPTLTYPPDIADKEALRAFLADTDIFGDAQDEGASYLEHALERFRITLAIAPEVPLDSSVLELGSNPYFFTRMLLSHGLDVRCANWFGDGAGPTGQQIVTGPASGVTDVIDYDHFNIELDRFPYPDGSFRLVFFCEILEHLARDPVNALAEIHRVLDKDNGWLVLSTPNPARTENLVKMLAGENVYEPMSGYGVHGRHNREYTVSELQELLNELGFVVDRIFTADVSPVPPEPLPSHPGLELSDRGEYVFVVARATGHDRWRYPNWLYQSQHALCRVVLPDLEVGRNDDLQTAGFHPRERIAGEEFRWMGLAPESRVLIRSTVAGRSVIRVQGLAAPIDAGPPITLQARIGDQSTTWGIDCGSGAFAVEAPVEVAAGDLEVILSTDRSWRPVDLELGSDPRSLGLAIHSVSIVPAG